MLLRARATVYLPVSSHGQIFSAALIWFHLPNLKITSIALHIMLLEHSDASSSVCGVGGGLTLRISGAIPCQGLRYCMWDNATLKPPNILFFKFYSIVSTSCSWFRPKLLQINDDVWLKSSWTKTKEILWCGCFSHLYWDFWASMLWQSQIILWFHSVISALYSRAVTDFICW